MRYDIITIFPDFFRSVFEYGVVSRAKDRGLLSIFVHNLRDFTFDRHQVVDDRPFGGGEGMVLKPEPVFRAVEHIASQPGPKKRAVVLLSAQGCLLKHSTAVELSGYDQMIMICGRYEGVDERIAAHLATHEIAIGDFVLSGGELAAALIVDATARLLPNVLGNEASTTTDSFTEGTLGCPQYTRPATYRGYGVPEVLQTGNHAAIAKWRREAALRKTAENRPDLLSGSERGEDINAIIKTGTKA